MTRERWATLKSLFNRASDLEGSERQLFLRELRDSNPTLADELEQLLHGAAGDSLRGPLEQPRPDSAPAAIRSPEPALQLNDLVQARYLVEEKLGAGGMGTVYRVHDQLTRHRLALKTLHAKLAAEPAFLARFTKELQLAQRINHPNICAVYHLEHTTGPSGQPLAYLLMQYLPGESLEARLSRGKLELGDALRIVQQVIDALAAAHAAGVTHRDLKAGNVMLVLQPDGTERVVLTDFGLALDQQATVAGGNPYISQFGPEAIVGTAVYMAPEQLLGEAVDHRADIHALGVLMYELVTNTVPFPGDTTLAVALRRLDGNAAPPLPDTTGPGARWNTATLACLERHADQRPANVAAVRAILAGESIAVPDPAPDPVPAPAPQTKRIPRRWLTGAVLTATAGALAFTGVRILMPDHTPEAERHFKLGEEFNKRRGRGDLQNAIQEYGKAVEISSGYAEAWAGLGEAWASAANFGMAAPGTKPMAKAFEAAQRAEALDPYLGRAVGVLGYCLSIDVHRWRKGEEYLKRAVVLDPKRANLRLWYASFLGKTGHRQQAIQQLQFGLQIDPTLFALYQQLSSEYLATGEYEKGLQAAEEVVRVQPSEGVGYLAVARAYMFLKKYPEGLAQCDQAALYMKGHAAVDATRAQLYAAAGDHATALTLANRLDALWRERKLEGGLLAKVYMSLGDQARVIAILRESAQRGEASLVGSLLSPNFQPLARNPEYVQLVRSVGIDPAILIARR